MCGAVFSCNIQFQVDVWWSSTEANYGRPTRSCEPEGRQRLNSKMPVVHLERLLQHRDAALMKAKSEGKLSIRSSESFESNFQVCHGARLEARRRDERLTSTATRRHQHAQHQNHPSRVSTIKTSRIVCPSLSSRVPASQPTLKRMFHVS